MATLPRIIQQITPEQDWKLFGQTIGFPLASILPLCDTMDDEDVRHGDVQEIVEVKRLFEEQTFVQESKAAEQAAQTQKLMRMVTELLGKKEQGGQTKEALVTGGEDRDTSASPTPREYPLSISEGAELGPQGDQPGEGEQDGDYGLTGEPTRTLGISQH